MVLFAQVADAALEKYSSLVVADKYPHAEPPTDTIRVTYLGVNGFQFEKDGHALLVDPYFTRVGFWSAALNQPIESNRVRVGEGLKYVSSRADAILVTHAHFDHLLDAPEIMRRTRAQLLAGQTAITIIESFGIPPNECKAVKAGDVRKAGPWTIRVFAAQHDRLFGKVPFNRCPLPRDEKSLPSPAASRLPLPEGEDEGAGAVLKRPMKPSDWCVGEPLAFVIEAAGKRIYIDSGGVPRAPLDSRIGHVDLAILGAALPDSRRRFAENVRQLEPRYVLPSHQDDFFAPLNRGFHFGKMTNFAELIRTQEKEHLPGRLILLDYFRPWTLR